MSKALLVSIALFLGGCQNTGYLLKTYSSSVAPKHVLTTETGTWWVFDRPDLGKIMTTPSPGTILGPAIVSGATVGLVPVDPLVGAHQQAAQRWFLQTNRQCTIKTSYEIWRPEFEHTYTCP